MTNEQMTEFRKELSDLCKKYEIKNASFTGTSGDKYIGIQCCDENKEYENIFLSTLNIGRLWQKSRDMIWDMFDEFDKRK